MCTRYHLDDTAYEAALNQLNINAEEYVLAPNKDIYPSEAAPVILSSGKNGKMLVVENQVWGFPSVKERGLQVNARAETVLENKNGKYRYVRAVVIDKDGKYAWTNPIFLD